MKTIRLLVYILTRQLILSETREVFCYHLIPFQAKSLITLMAGSRKFQVRAEGQILDISPNVSKISKMDTSSLPSLWRPSN